MPSTKINAALNIGRLFRFLQIVVFLKGFDGLLEVIL
jgi:hypothetical protein